MMNLISLPKNHIEVYDSRNHVIVLQFDVAPSPQNEISIQPTRIFNSCNISYVYMSYPTLNPNHNIYNV